MEKYTEDHSEEVREIMNQKANWMVRGGVILLGLIVAVVLAVFFLISYPVFVSVPFQVTNGFSNKAEMSIAGEAVAGETLYDQIQIGQEVQAKLTGAGQKMIIGEVDDKLPEGRIHIIFPVKDIQQLKVRTALLEVGTVKIKTDEKRLITQLKSLFIPK